MNEELSEKRCLSLKHCPQQATEYYGDAPMSLSNSNFRQDESYHRHKALCASWAESFAFDKEMEYGPETAQHHQEARRIVMNDPKLKQECRQIAMNLAQCLRRKRLF
jgi:predicted ATPase